jgi:hypothetical protein
MIRTALICGSIIGLLAGCSDPDKQVLFDGQQFNGRLKADKEAEVLKARVKPHGSRARRIAFADMVGLISSGSQAPKLKQLR